MPHIDAKTVGAHTTIERPVAAQHSVGRGECLNKCGAVVGGGVDHELFPTKLAEKFAHSMGLGQARGLGAHQG